MAVQHGVDTLLRLDPDTRAALDRIDGKIIMIKLQSPETQVALSVVDRRIEVLRAFDGDVDTTICGSASDLLSLQKSNDVLYRGDVRIDGDLSVAEQFKDIVGGLQLDWEEWISPLTGDSAAHQLGEFSRQLSGWLSRTHDSMRSNTSDYLQEEVQLVAPNSEVQRFCADVDELRARADRFAARLALLEAGVSTQQASGE